MCTPGVRLLSLLTHRHVRSSAVSVVNWLDCASYCTCERVAPCRYVRIHSADRGCRLGLRQLRIVPAWRDGPRVGIRLLRVHIPRQSSSGFRARRVHCAAGRSVRISVRCRLPCTVQRDAVRQLASASLARRVRHTLRPSPPRVHPSRYANEVIGVYTDIVDEMLGKECSACLNTESTIELQVMAANAQNFGGEIAYVVLSFLQARLLPLPSFGGCAAWLCGQQSCCGALALALP
jgi:hypothetical protein